MSNKYTYRKCARLIMTLAVPFLFSGCKKYLEVPMPIDQLTTGTVFESKPTIVAAVNGVYGAFSEGLLKAAIYYRNTYLHSDEAEFNPIPGNEFGDIIRANIVPTNTSLASMLTFYRTIYRANELLDKLPNVKAGILTDAEKKTYIAAAKYVRAAEYYALVTSWGDVPLTFTTSSDVNINMGRTPASQVFAQIEKDLKEAAADLPATVNVTNSKTIHNKYQPLALLARVYLYQGKWAEAENAANEVINSGQYQMVAGVNNVFKRGSREAIFSMGATGTGLLYENRAVIGWVILPASASAASTLPFLSTTAQAQFETGDQRFVNGNWTTIVGGLRFPNKYLYNSATPAATTAANPQDFIYQRLAEIYLIRAEARAQQDKLTGANGAVSDLNIVRARAGLPNTTSTTKTTILASIEKERLTELFFEGHRWYDLKRTGRLAAVLGTLPWKSANFKPHMQFWPIQNSELLASPNLKQNPGY